MRGVGQYSRNKVVIKRKIMKERKETEGPETEGFASYEQRANGGIGNGSATQEPRNDLNEPVGLDDMGMGEQNYQDHGYEQFQHTAFEKSPMANLPASDVDLLSHYQPNYSQLAQQTGNFFFNNGLDPNFMPARPIFDDAGAHDFLDDYDTFLPGNAGQGQGPVFGQQLHGVGGNVHGNVNPFANSSYPGLFEGRYRELEPGFFSYAPTYLAPQETPVVDQSRNEEEGATERSDGVEGGPEEASFVASTSFEEKFGEKFEEFLKRFGGTWESEDSGAEK